MSQSPNKPVKDCRIGTAISVSVWKNETQKEDGRTSVWYQVKPQNRYRDKDGKYHDSAYLRLQDIPVMIKALEMAFDYLCEVQSSGPTTDDSVTPFDSDP